MSESLSTYVRRVSNPGPNSKAVSLAKNADGEALWVWVPKDVIIAPGMIFSCEKVSFGALETTYVKNGKTETLNVPKRQVFTHAQIVIDAPEHLPIVTDVVVTDAAQEYAEKYAAAQARREDPSEDDGEEPF